MKSAEYWMEFSEVHAECIDKIVEVFNSEGISPEEGEQILLFAAGMVAGLCQRPLTKNGWSEAVVRGWEIGVIVGD